MSDMQDLFAMIEVDTDKGNFDKRYFENIN